MGGSAIVYAWAQVFSGVLIAWYDMKIPSKFTGVVAEDAVFGLMVFIIAPAPLLAGILWLFGNFPLHAGEVEEKKKRK